MPTVPDDVRFRWKTGSDRPTVKPTRMTHSRPAHAPHLQRNIFAAVASAMIIKT
jgi:hypothetical protein